MRDGMKVLLPPAQQPGAAGSGAEGAGAPTGQHASAQARMPPIEEQLGISVPITSRVPQRCALNVV